MLSITGRWPISINRVPTLITLNICTDCLFKYFRRIRFPDLMVRYGGTFSLRSTQSKKEKEKRTLCAALNSPFQSRHGILLLVGSFPFSFFSFHNADTWDTIFNCNSQTDGAIKTRAKKKKKEVASKAHTFFFFFIFISSSFCCWKAHRH